MTTLTIIPNWKNKTAKFKGTVAAGEHVAVRIVNDNGEGDEYIQAEDLANLRLRVVNPANGKTLAQFPMPVAEGETPDAWDDTNITPLTCELNLNTDRMLMAVPPAANVPLLFVLDAYEGATDEDEGEFTLYFKDMCEVTHWPRRRGEDEPTRLDDYKDLIEDFRERIDAAEDSIRDAVDEANGIVAHVDAAKTASETARDVANQAAASAQSQANAAGNAANEAKSYRNTAEEHKNAAASSATSAANSATAAEQWATGGTGGTPSATNNAKHYAEAAAASAQEAEETLENKADKATTLAGYGIADAYTKTETDGKISTAVSAEATARNTAIANAINAVKDSAPEAFDTLKEIADWIGDDQNGAAAMAARLSQLSQNKVDKVAGKGLSTNDYTAADKEKLSGVEAGAKDNVVEAASASAFPQQGVTGKIYVAKDENKAYRWNGSQYVQIGGGGGSSVTVDPTLSVEGAAADAKATGDALAGKRDKDDLALYRKVGVGGTWTLVSQDGTINVQATGSYDPGEFWEFWIEEYGVVAGTGGGVAETAYEVEWSGLGVFAGKSGTATRPFAYQSVTGDALAKESQIPTTPSDIGAATAAQGAKADTAVQPAALPYALNAITPTTETVAALPDSAFPIMVDIGGVSHTYSASDVVFRYLEPGDAPPSVYPSDDDAGWQATVGSDGFVIYFDTDGVLVTYVGVDNYPVWGDPDNPTPGLDFSMAASATLADRAVNFVAGAFSALALTLPAQQDGKSRDFYLQIVNPADQYPVTVNGARLIDASGASVTLTAPANQTTWRFTETRNAATSPSADPVFVVTGANELAAMAGKYAKPSGGIPKTDMASAVQTSLGKADTAVQPAALAGAVRYDLPADATVISSASSEEIEGATVYYGEATLADRTANRVAITAEIAELRLTFPAAVSGKVRDFGLRVEVGDGTAALTAPALVPVEPTGETITLENPDAAIPALADGAADAKGVTLLYFSETAPGKFLVKGEQVKEA